MQDAECLAPRSPRTFPILTAVPEPEAGSITVFKFFRKYNKIILVVGASLLMVAFLIQGTLDMFLMQPGEEDYGQIGDRDVTVGQIQSASSELAILSRLLGEEALRGLFSGATGEEDLKWLLMVEEAREFGLSTSEAEVMAVLQVTGQDEDALATLVGSPWADAGFVRQAVRHWLIVEAHRELTSGLAFALTPGSEVHSPGYRRLLYTGTAHRLREENRFAESEFARLLSMGSQRISEPLNKHLLYGQGSIVSGKVVLVSGDQYLNEIAEPDEDRLRQLFDDYRKFEPQEQRPYGFGYRVPDRVKVEYLTVPYTQVEALIEVEEAEVLDYYDVHPMEFMETEGPQDIATSQPPPYETVRDRIVEKLVRKKADRLSTQAMKAARFILMDQLQGVPTSGGYKLLPDDFVPMPLSELAEELEAEYGIKPVIEQLDVDWITQDELDRLPGIGNAMLTDQRFASFSEYVLSAKELKPDAQDPLVPLRLQVNLPSHVLRSFLDRSQFLFRLLDAEASVAPNNMDQVREQVEADARQIAVYERLIEESEQWLSRGREQGLEVLAEQLQVDLLDVKDLSLRTISPEGGFMATSVRGIGASQVFVDAIFAQAELLAAEGPVHDLSVAERTGVVGIDHRLALGLYRVDRFNPISQSDYLNQATDSQSLLSNLMTRLTDQSAIPLSFGALKSRVRFQRSGEVQDMTGAINDEPFEVDEQQ